MLKSDEVVLVEKKSNFKINSKYNDVLNLVAKYKNKEYIK